MDNSQNKESFNYTYSAEQQEEIRRIRQKYEAPKEDKMAELRRLDARVSNKATVISLIIGVVGALIMGFGMSLAMTSLGEMIGIVRPFAIGIIIGVIGIAVASLAYPIYCLVLKKEREQVAHRIIELSDELMNK